MHADNVPAAKRLRQESTATESTLWERLRDRRCMNLKFRRQHPVGRFVLDFYCEALRVAIEVDGGIHEDPAQKKADLERQLDLERLGIRFIRIPTQVIEVDPSGLMHFLTETLALQNGTPLPSRERGRGEGERAAMQRRPAR